MTRNHVLKISTAGSVDDGKSTLIGRLLYDTQSLKKDKIEAIERSSRQKGFDYLDFSLATDGLVAERQQGITIDVAHIYFGTKNRSYIIADTPGHIEYTRNMITGASTSDVSIILIDARNGVMEQTRRHYFISNLLRIKYLVVVINKMDLVGYNEKYFLDIVKDFQALSANSAFEKIYFVPVSALFGDNIVRRSDSMHWYGGPTLMDLLESMNPYRTETNPNPRLQVQTVIRPKTVEFADFRGYAGRIRGGELAVGDDVLVLPSGTRTGIRSIEFYNKEYDRAGNGASVTLTLKDDVDASRGDMIVKAMDQPEVSNNVTAMICWMDHQPMTVSKTYFLQHGVNLVKCKVTEIKSRVNETFTGEEAASTLELNDLGVASFRLSKSIPFDSFQKNRSSGAFILIDPITHATSGVGLIQVQ